MLTFEEDLILREMSTDLKEILRMLIWIYQKHNKNEQLDNVTVWKGFHRSTIIYYLDFIPTEKALPIRQLLLLL